MQHANVIAIVLALGCSLAGAQAPERMARLTDSNVLLKQAAIEGNAMHACLPAAERGHGCHPGDQE